MNYRFLRSYAAGTALLFAVDQFSKYMAHTLLKGKGAVPVLGPFLQFLYLQNEGAAFGVLRGRQWIFIVFALAMTLLSVWFTVSMPDQARYFPLRILCMTLSAGALGNMADRLLHHYVIDFIYLRFIDFPVFNVADIYVTVSCLVFLLLMFFRYTDEDMAALSGKRKKDR